MSANTTSIKSTVYVTPEWVFEAGAESYTYTSSSGYSQEIPVWTDEIFLEKLNNLVEALRRKI